MCGRGKCHIPSLSELGHVTSLARRRRHLHLSPAVGARHLVWQHLHLHLHLPAPDTMPRELLEICLSRAGARQPWGFRIIGGRDEGRVCKVEKVNTVLKIFPDILGMFVNQLEKLEAAKTA